MKRVYVVLGENNETENLDHVYCAYATMEKAEDKCIELESHPDNNHIWYWQEIVLED